MSIVSTSFSWTKTTFVSGGRKFNKWRCSVLTDATTTRAIPTAITPVEFDTGKRAWFVFNSLAVALDTGTAFSKIFLAWSRSATLTGAATFTCSACAALATAGAEVNCGDPDTTAVTYFWDPEAQGTLHMPCPGLFLGALMGTDTADVVTCTFEIIQEAPEWV